MRSRSWPNIGGTYGILGSFHLQGRHGWAWALPRFWVSIRSYKKQPVKEIWDRILCLAWLKFAVVPLRTAILELNW